MIVIYEPAAREEIIEAVRWYVDVAGVSVANQRRRPGYWRNR